MSKTSQPITFPIANAPAPGEALEVVPGVRWLRTLLPFHPHAVNLWLLQDVNGWTMVDCGFPAEDTRRHIESAWSDVLDGMSITRLIATHHHPDHIGNCRWICNRWKLAPTITAGEHREIQTLMRERAWVERAAFWRKHGVPEEVVVELKDELKSLSMLFDQLPADCNFIQDGDRLRIGDYDWHVIVVSGHSPEQALLHSPARGLLIAGDQILTKITPNVGVYADDPNADPLTLFLESNRQIADACGDVLVLPSHGMPFYGLHARILELEEHHKNCAAKAAEHIESGPRTAVAMIPALFGEVRRTQDLPFALGEALAHLQYLVMRGRASRKESNGRVLFRTAR